MALQLTSLRDRLSLSQELSVLARLVGHGAHYLPISGSSTEETEIHNHTWPVLLLRARICVKGLPTKPSSHLSSSLSLFWTSVKILKPVAMNRAFSLSLKTAPNYLPLPCLMQLPSRLPLLSPSAFLASDSEGTVLPLFSSFHQQPLRALACLACYVNLSSQIPIKLSSCPPESVLKGTPCSLVTSPIASLTPSAPLPSSPSPCLSLWTGP